MPAALDSADVRERLISGCQAVIDARDRLTKADQAIGDGDHGVSMARGFEAALKSLNTAEGVSVADLFKALGMAIMTTSGGASGAVFGTFFISGSLPLTNATALDGPGFVAMLRAGLEAVQKRGGAKPGDKTMIDALVPAIEQAEAARSDDAVAVLEAGSSGALEGVTATIDMLAATGKARSLGERSRGHPDPGAITLSVFLGAFAGVGMGSG